jgi:O-antigen ligase
VGLGAYGNAHYVYAQSPRFDPIARGHRDTHNTYLNLMAETGLIGFACFAALVVVTLREARRTRKKLQATHPALASQLFFLEIGAYGYLVAGIWGTYGRLVLTYFYLAIVYATARLFAREETPAVKPLMGKGVAQRPAHRASWHRRRGAPR